MKDKGKNKDSVKNKRILKREIEDYNSYGNYLTLNGVFTNRRLYRNYYSIKCNLCSHTIMTKNRFLRFCESCRETNMYKFDDWFPGQYAKQKYGIKEERLVNESKRKVSFTTKRKDEYNRF